MSVISLLFRKHDCKLCFSYISPAADVDTMRYLVLWGAQEWRQRMTAMRWERAGGVNKNNF